MSAGPSAPRAELAPGALLAERYRLHRLVSAPGAEPATWQALDEVLARPVAVRALAAADPRAPALAAAAARAGAVQERTLARVFDAATGSGVAYVIREWVEGRPLAELVATEPVGAVRALAMATDAARALVALHAAGVKHGGVHPGNVLLDERGRVRLTDAGTGLAVRGTAGAAPMPDSPVDGEAADVRDLAAVLHALTTGRWPATATGQPGRGLPAAAGHGSSPRQVRAGVPRALDAVVVRALTPGGRAPLTTAPALLAALEQAADAVGRESDPRTHGVPVGPRRPGLLRRSVPYAVVLALLGAVGVGAYSAGLSVGEVPGSTAEEAFDAPPPVPPGSAEPVVVDLDQLGVTDYDPYGSPPEENRDEVANAYDGEASTTWPTELYRTAGLGGLKPGVGLLVDLGAPAAISRVDLDLLGAGTAVTLRAGDALGEDEQALPVVTSSDGVGGTARLQVPAGTEARYWLVWVTRLPPDDGAFRAGVDEMSWFR